MKVRCEKGHFRRVISSGSYCPTCHGESQNRHKKKFPLTRNEIQWRYRNISCTQSLYNELVVAQNNLCAICLKPEAKRRLAVDHNHITGQIRGLLCMYCNKVILPLVENKKDILKRAESYLTKI